MNSQNERYVWIQLSIQSIQYGRQCAWGGSVLQTNGLSNACIPYQMHHHWCMAHTHAWLSIDHPQPFCADSLELIAVLQKLVLGQWIGLPICPQYYRQHVVQGELAIMEWGICRNIISLHLAPCMSGLRWKHIDACCQFDCLVIQGLLNIVVASPITQYLHQGICLHCCLYKVRTRQLEVATELFLDL